MYIYTYITQEWLGLLCCLVNILGGVMGLSFGFLFFIGWDYFLAWETA